MGLRPLVKVHRQQAWEVSRRGNCCLISMEEHKKRNGLSSHISLGYNSHDTKNFLVGTTPEITTLETKPSNQGPNHSILSLSPWHSYFFWAPWVALILSPSDRRGLLPSWVHGIIP